MAPLRVVRYPDAVTFLDRAGLFLTRQEAMNNLILGLATTFARDPGAYPAGIVLRTIESTAEVVLAALRTPPNNLVLSAPEAAADSDVSLLVDDFVHDPLPGVLGPRDVAAAFVAAWTRASGAQAGLVVRERIYELVTVNPPAHRADGEMRRLTPQDRRLLEQWTAAFTREAFPELPDPEREAHASVTRHLRMDRDAGYFAWVVAGEPVALAGFGGPTTTGIRVGPVYTPPIHRRNSYAGNLVANVSRWLLNAGYARCFLFTDLSNVTSNRIYQEIGYRAVGDVDQYGFT